MCDEAKPNCPAARTQPYPDGLADTVCRQKSRNKTMNALRRPALLVQAAVRPPSCHTTQMSVPMPIGGTGGGRVRMAPGGHGCQPPSL
eukprot:352770-Chlamydomonas_euryale.AAC.9